MEREGYGFPPINCHSFPGYFVRKTCPGEKEFLLLLLRDWERDTASPSLVMEYCELFLWLPPAAEGPEQGTGPGGALRGLGTPQSCLSPTPWLQKASIELALHWAAAPAGQGLRASLGDRTTKSWKELPLFLSSPPLLSNPAEV